jgi:putative ABC transport system permease protein
VSLWESFISSIYSLCANKLRSSLTILGIVIGVSAVVFLVSLGEGQKEQMTSSFEEMGANAIYITTAGMTEQIQGATGTLTLEDAQALADPYRAPSVEIVAPMIEKMATVIYGNENASVDLIGITPQIADIIAYPVAKGDFINDQDIKRRTDVAVLGHQTAINLFGEEDPLGKTIRASGRRFEVIGVIEKKGGMMGAADDFIMIPLTTMQSRIVMQTSAKGRPVQTIAIKAVGPDEIEAATEQITEILRQRHNIREGEDDDFNVVDMQDILNTMQEILVIFQLFLGSVGAISLVVGGIGIMNIMLVSVTERTREIGIRKAVGAKRRDIIIQFLVESAMLSLTGGVIGLLIALGGTSLINNIDVGFPISAPISASIIIVALTVSIGIGLTSGTYPAFRAARLDPIESLRHE